MTEYRGLDILDYFDNHDMIDEDEDMHQSTLRRIVLTAFEIEDWNKGFMIDILSLFSSA